MGRSLLAHLRELWLPSGMGEGARFSPDPFETMVVSYPRSGNTWVRFILTGYLVDGPPTLDEVERIVPDIYQTRERELSGRAARIYKSHEQFRPDYMKVLYLMRHPVEVCLSYYRYFLKTRKIEASDDFSDFSQAFVRGQLNDGFGSWEAHVKGWARAREDTEAQIHLVRYEDLMQDGAAAIWTSLRDLGIARDYERLDRAVQASTLERMKRLEMKGHQPRGLANSRRDIPFFGSRFPIGERNAYQEQALSDIRNAWGEYVEELGYRLESN